MTSVSLALSPALSTGGAATTTTALGGGSGAHRRGLSLSPTQPAAPAFPPIKSVVRNQTRVFMYFRDEYHPPPTSGSGSGVEGAALVSPGSGDYELEHVLDLDKSIFCINGHFDHDNIFKDAIVPLQNEDGNRFYGKVLEVGDDKVKIDLNHPLAGKTLNFKGHIVEAREASNEEIQGLINRMSGEGCCCGGHGEDGCCGHHHDHEGGCCGHGHEHKDGGCCHRK